MRTYDLTPVLSFPLGLTASSTCLTGSVRRQPWLSPLHIERTGENAYRISVAGLRAFSQGELSIVAKRKTPDDPRAKKPQRRTVRDKSEVLYRGTPPAAFRGA